MGLNVFEIILWLGVIQGFLLSVILITHKSNQPANRILGIAIFFLSAELFYLVIVKIGIFENFLILTGLLFSMLFIYVPMLYLYVLKITGSPINIRKVYFHFIPLILCVVFFFPVYLGGAAYRNTVLINIHEGKYFAAQIVNMIKPFYGVLYIIMLLYLIRKHNNRLKNSFSNLDKINLSWLKNLSVALIVITIIVIIQNISEFIYGDESVFQYFLFISIAGFIYLIGYFGLKQPEIFTQVNLAAEEIGVSNTAIEAVSRKYEKSGLNNSTAEEYLKRLLEYMDEEKPYLKGNITLVELSSMLSITAHNLSEVINSKLNQNFYDFVNSYKVKEVKRLIQNDQEMKFSILALGLEAGFSSKSSFYSAFKKETGMTPAQYRKSVC